MINMEQKTAEQLLQEEKEKLQSEINNKIKTKKKFMDSEKPQTGFKNLSNK